MESHGVRRANSGVDGRIERQIAVGLYGKARVEEEWYRNGWMRGRL